MHSQLSVPNKSNSSQFLGKEGGGCPPGPAAVKGAGASLPRKGGQEGVQAAVTEHAGSLNFWSPVPCRPLRGCLLSLTLSVYLRVTNIWFYVFSGPLSFFASINTSHSGEDKQGHNHAIK